MGHHGWQGDPPRTEELARERLIDAATRCIARMGVPKTTLSDVAAEVGVTRQTVYRYFPNLTDLLTAVAETGAADFVARMEAHLSSAETPLDVFTESVLFSLREIPKDPRIGILLEADDQSLFGHGVTSAVGVELGSRILRNLSLDWSAFGIDDDELDDLAELMMRLMVSFLQHPPATPRSPDELRAFVGRWLQPALGTRSGEVR
jgi:AcrR family transcriptional regulator